MKLAPATIVIKIFLCLNYIRNQLHLFLFKNYSYEKDFFSTSFIFDKHRLFSKNQFKK